jgi:hypothetical protein
MDAAAVSMDDRRRFSRHPVSWYVRLWVDEGSFVSARAVDASLHGMRIALTENHPPIGLEVGHPRRVEVFLPERDTAFTRVGEVRHVGDHGIGLYIREPLPADLISELPADGVASVTDVLGATSAEPPRRPWEW